MDYLEKEEIKYLDDTQQEIYARFKKKAALNKYNKLCVSERICPICGSGLSYTNVCHICDSAFSIYGKKLND